MQLYVLIIKSTGRRNLTKRLRDKVGRGRENDGVKAQNEEPRYLSYVRRKFVVAPFLNNCGENTKIQRD